MDIYTEQYDINDITLNIRAVGHMFTIYKHNTRDNTYNYLDSYFETLCLAHKAFNTIMIKSPINKQIKQINKTIKGDK